MTRYETLTLLSCASRVAQAFSHRSRPATELSEWLERNPLGFEWDPESDRFRSTQLSRQGWSDLQAKLALDFIARLLTGALTRRAEGVNILLYGPPGTGKSAFARHLAEVMGLPVVHKRASDLMGMHVGHTPCRQPRPAGLPF